MIHYQACPVCKRSSIEHFFDVKDHSVSGETFPLWKCRDCSFVFTQDVPEESAIGRYYAADAYISHTDTREGAINKLYHTIRKRTLAGKYRLVKHCTGLSKGNLLDIGAGTGAFLSVMQYKGWTVTGLEPDATARANAGRLHNIHPLPAGELFNLPAASFDAITMWHVLEHVHRLDEYMVELKRLLKPAGRLFIAVPNYTSHDAAHYGADWAAWDVPRHLYHFSPACMKLLLERNGFSTEAMMPMWYDSFYVSMLSEQYKNNKGNLVKAVMTGLLSNAKAALRPERCSSLIYISRLS